MVTDKEIEEVANEYVKSMAYRYLDTPKTNAAIDFQAGAKWMQEKIKIDNHHCDQHTEEVDGEWVCTICGNG